jgi:hypothetical protein
MAYLITSKTRGLRERKLSYNDMMTKDIRVLRKERGLDYHHAMEEVHREVMDAPRHEQEKLYQKIYSQKE